jgi:TMEM175 potassium channel family protein
MTMSEEKREASIEKETGRKETSRIEAFSDGVFAVAITLLVFDLKVPLPSAGDSFTKAGLGIALFHQWPSYLAFITSFATILIMWVSHHSIFKLVDKSDKPFLFANGFLLMLVTVVPFPTSLVAAYLTTPAAATACAVYSGIFVVINFAYNLLWWIITRHRLLNPTVTPAQARVLTRNLLLGFPVYLFATLLAFWNPYVTIAICSGLWIFWAFTSFERSPVTTTSLESRM